MEIYKFIPYLKTVIWGGKKIAARKHITVDAANIGESWEISGLKGHESLVAEGVDKGLTLNQLVDKYGKLLLGSRVFANFNGEFPLLVKFIDAADDLSVQVHPDEFHARTRHNCAGKTEMWYVIDAEPDAKIYCGWDNRITRGKFVDMVARDTIMNHIAAHTSAPGDVYYIPAGRVHSIGRGNLLVEVQLPSDITYRIYDHGRVDSNGFPRQLHILEARDVVELSSDCTAAGKPKVDSQRLTTCEFFTVDRIVVNGERPLPEHTPDSFTILVNVGTSPVQLVTTESQITPLAPFETALIPASLAAPILRGSSTLILARP